MIELRPATVAFLEAALVGDDALADALGCSVAPGWCTFAEALPFAREAIVNAGGDATWGTRMFVSGDPAELVGWGGFKGPPHEGAVEVGYEIAPPRQQRGLATAAVHAMLAEAFADARIHRVIAHTLAERNAVEHGSRLGRERWVVERTFT
jgi:RimJ/RimL family protein N-acetyltransferase